MGARSNNIHKWQIGVGTPDTISPNAIPNVGGTMARIANARAQNMFADIKQDAQKSGARFKEKAQHLDNFNKNLSNLIQVFGKQEAANEAEQLRIQAANEAERIKQQKALEAAQERNDQLLASEISSQYDQHMYEQSVNPDGFMHTIYRPSDENGEGSSCERSLTKTHDDFFLRSESFKAASPKVQELVKENTTKTFGRYYNQVIKKDYENRYRYQKNTERKDSDSYLASIFNAGEDVSGWVDTDNIPAQDRDKIIQMIHHEAEINTIAFFNGRDGEDFSDVFEFENGSSYWHPLVRNTPEARERLQKLIKEAAGHIVIGSEIKKLSAICESDDSAAASLIFGNAEAIAKKLPEQQADLLMKNVDAFQKKREMFLKKRAIDIMSSDQQNLLTTYQEVVDNSDYQMKINILGKRSSEVINNYNLIAEADPKLAQEHKDQQLTSIAIAALGSIREEFTSTYPQLYSELFASQMKSNEAYSKSREQNRQGIDDAVELQHKRIEELKKDPTIGSYVTLAVDSINKERLKDSKSEIKRIEEEIKLGGKRSDTGVFIPIDRQKITLELEHLFFAGGITKEDRFRLMDELKKSIKFDEQMRKDSIDALSQFTGISTDRIEEILGSTTTDYKGFDQYNAMLDLIPDDGKEQTTWLNARGKKINVTHDALFSLYAYLYNHYTNGQIIYGDSRKGVSAIEALKKLTSQNAGKNADGSPASLWFSITNEDRVNAIRNIIANSQEHANVLFGDESFRILTAPEVTIKP